jgi:carbonic anhydrase/acetyltransferase-like protein (isoleucine patch superfamily)
MAIYQLDDVVPQIAATAWVADSASVIGNVVLEEGASVWYGAVLRGDNDRIHLGRNTNIQDGSVLHTDAGMPLTLGDNVTVGHQVMLHGCSIGDGTLVGIQAVVLNGAKIGRHCIVGAGALVTEGKEFPDGSLIVGAPAKLVRMLTPERFEALAGHLAGHYVVQTRRHRGGIKRIV